MDKRTAGELAVALIDEVREREALTTDQLISLAQACAVLQVSQSVDDLSNLVHDIRLEARLWFNS